MSTCNICTKFARKLPFLDLFLSNGHSRGICADWTRASTSNICAKFARKLPFLDLFLSNGHSRGICADWTRASTRDICAKFARKLPFLDLLTKTFCYLFKDPPINKSWMLYLKSRKRLAENWNVSFVLKFRGKKHKSSPVQNIT